MEIANLDIKFLPGVGNRKAMVLEEELGVKNYEDMLYHIPYRYVDRSRSSSGGGNRNGGGYSSKRY